MRDRTHPIRIWRRTHHSHAIQRGAPRAAQAALDFASAGLGDSIDLSAERSGELWTGTRSSRIASSEKAQAGGNGG